MQYIILGHLFNRCLVESLFLNAMKLSCIKPIYKNKSIFDVSNYITILIMHQLLTILGKKYTLD